jgi:hypothetical protein
MSKIYIADELSKDAQTVFQTAAKRGYVIDGDWLEHVDNIDLDQAFTKSELRDHLRDVVFHLNEGAGLSKREALKLKECRIIGGRYIELDSTNLSHAGIYYIIGIELPDRARQHMEKSQDIFTLDEINARIR